MNLIKTYFTRQLEKRGYPTDDICYSLNYCQGDGMAWYGDIEEEALISFADKLMKDTEKAAVKRAINKGATVTIERNSYATHYSHYNTMSVIAEACYGEELTDFEWASFQSFEQALEEDVKATSQSLESNGYAIIDAGSKYGALADKKRTFNTARFSLIIEESEDKDFSVQHWDESLIDDTVQACIDKKLRYFTLRVSVIEREDETVLGESYLGGCTESNDSPSKNYDGHLRQMVSEAIREARDFVNSISLAA
ncbi:hypothetical protein [Alteromonas gracilis]|uniref:hypothetical protein n=1 Tax=Alteromonas gracilis TaxID=1479524 RepID=UPI0037364344